MLIKALELCSCNYTQLTLFVTISLVFHYLSLVQQLLIHFWNPAFHRRLELKVFLREDLDCASANPLETKEKLIISDIKLKKNS